MSGPARSRSNLAVVLIITAALLWLPANGLAATFMFINGLPGESADDQHKDWIDLLSYSQTVGNRACAKVIVSKHVDRASPGLAALAVTNQVIPTVLVEVRKEGENPLVFFRATLEQVVIGQTELTDQEGAAVTERVSLLPKTVRIQYTQQRSDGSSGSVVNGVVSCP